MEIIHHHFETLSSTNDWAKEHLPALLEKQLLVVTATQQNGGRGQYGRHWLSPQGNLYATFAFLSPIEQEPLLLTRHFALSAAKVLQTLGVESHLKWPNDLLVNQKKIAGILCETLSLGSLWGVAIGIGLNVNMSLKDLAAINQPATSLLVETGTSHPLPPLLNLLRENCFSYLNDYFRRIL